MAFAFVNLMVWYFASVRCDDGCELRSDWGARRFDEPSDVPVSYPGWASFRDSWQWAALWVLFALSLLSFAVAFLIIANPRTRKWTPWALIGAGVATSLPLLWLRSGN